MALSATQKSSRLFKKSLGAGETLLTRDFFEEPKLGNTNILPSQIWTDESLIPTHAPTLADQQISGVVQYFSKLSLSFVAGSVSGSSDVAYYHANLIDAIPFNYSDGSYNYALYKSDGTTQIAFGDGDWLVDTSAGVLTFYGTVPSAVSHTQLPQISFYRYVGDKGLAPSGATNGLTIKDPVSYATASGDTLINYNSATSGYTTIPASIDGISSGGTFTEGVRILVKCFTGTTALQNGIFQISGTTLARSVDNDGVPVTEVAVNDYVFVMSGNTNIASSWVLSSTNAFDVHKIVVGQDTQIWSLFARSAAYTSDNLAIKLNGQQFSLLLDTGGTYQSGLQQSISGLRLSDSLASVISGAVSNNTSLSNALSTEASTRGSADTSLSSALSSEISVRSSAVTSLSSAVLAGISTEISDRTSADTSLSSVLSSEISVRTSVDTSLSTAVSTLSGVLSSEISARASADLSLSSSIYSYSLSLSSALSSEISTRSSGITSLSTALANFSGVTTKTAGSGLTYLSGNTSLNINVDDWTIRIITGITYPTGKLVGTQQWLQQTTSANVTGVTSGYTGLALTYDSVTPVAAYVNGIEYLVNPFTHPTTNYPFFYNAYPPVAGTQIWFDPTSAGFTLVSGTDMVVIKYLVVEDLIQ